jgi:hypothetical protein
MSLKDYLVSLQAVISETPFIISTSLTYDERPPSAGLIKGTLFFTDGSQLDFKEFMVTQPVVEILKYAYNYRKENRLIFRYDNANDPSAKVLPTYPLHKHTPAGIFTANKPSLRLVLKEIVSQLKIP